MVHHYKVKRFQKIYIKFLDSSIRLRLILLMFKSIENFTLPLVHVMRKFGFEIISPLSGLRNSIDKPKKVDYNKYYKKQVKLNKQKIERVFAVEKNLRFTCDLLIKKYREKPLNVICHGTRNGFEQDIFLKYLTSGSNVIGTEISPTATKFANTIEWDFSKAKLEWNNSFDVVYSNSHDHAINLKETLQVWLDSLNDEGVIILEHSLAHEWVHRSEPSAVKVELLPFLILKWFKEKAYVESIYQLSNSSKLGERNFLILISKIKSGSLITKIN